MPFNRKGVASIGKPLDIIRRAKKSRWSRRSDLNRQPTDYESVALPLSYAGPTCAVIHSLPRGIGKCQGGEDPPWD